MRALATILLLGATIAAARGDDLPPCTLGMHLDAAGSAYQAAVVTAVDDVQGAYRVRYDGSTIEEWVNSNMLRYSCVGTRSGATAITFFTDNWDQVFQRGEPDLVVRTDGTYAWLVAIDPDKVITGIWHEANADQLGSAAVGPGIVLEDALFDQDWVVASQGDIDDSDREQVLANDLSGDYFYFYRSRGPSTK